MRMKKGLLMVVLLLAISSVMAAMSYSSATVTNDMSVSLVNTQDALLALDASPEHNAASVGHITSDMLEINLDKGNGNDFGLQPNSVYTWGELFKVTNNSEHKVKVTIKTDRQLSENRIAIHGSIDGNNWVKFLGRHSGGGELTFTLEPGVDQWVDIKADTMNGHAKTSNFKLVVEAEKQ
jgi:hypothetical protein